MDGLAPAMVTPFDRAGQLDVERLVELVAWFEARGVDFLVPCGSTGSAPLLTAAERRTVIETVVDAASVPVLAGTGQPGRMATVAASRDAAAAGADGVLVVTPFYYTHEQPALADYYASLVDAVSVPIHLYSVPKFTGTRLEPDTVDQLAGLDGIVGMKDSSGDIATVFRLLEVTANRPSFDLLVGATPAVDPALARGAAGGILGIANVAPALAGDVVSSAERPAPAATRLQHLDTEILGRYGIPGVKCAMRSRGVSAGYPRSPFQPLADAARERIDRTMKTVGLD